MHDTVPNGSRAAARVLLINDQDQILYLRARESSSGKEFWVMPGGGLESQESFEDAAVREVKEETGLQVKLGPCIWTRHQVYSWLGKKHDQYEVFFMARVSATAITPPQPDEYVIGHRWWALEQLEQSDENFAPTRIVTLLEPILAGDYPNEPFDCGV